MNIAICDDNAAERAAVCACMRDYCYRNSAECNIREFPDGGALLQAFEPGAFDLIFLDVYMPGPTGVEVARKIRQSDAGCALVFITVSPEHALDAFSVQAASYVIKPIRRESMDRALRACKPELAKKSRYIEVLSNHQTVRIPFVNILYVEVYGKLTCFHTSTGDVQTRTPLDEVEDRLRGAPFLRCHRCYLVNMSCVRDVRAEDFLMKNGDSVPIRQKGRAGLKLAVGRFLMSAAFGGDAE